MQFGLGVANQNQKTKIKTLYILKMLHTGCSMKEAILLLLSRSTYNFQKKEFYTFKRDKKKQTN